MLDATKESVLAHDLADTQEACEVKLLPQQLEQVRRAMLAYAVAALMDPDVAAEVDRECNRFVDEYR